MWTLELKDTIFIANHISLSIASFKKVSLYLLKPFTKFPQLKMDPNWHSLSQRITQTVTLSITRGKEKHFTKKKKKRETSLQNIPAIGLVHRHIRWTGRWWGHSVVWSSDELCNLGTSSGWSVQLLGLQTHRIWK